MVATTTTESDDHPPSPPPEIIQQQSGCLDCRSRISQQGIEMMSRENTAGLEFLNKIEIMARETRA